MKRLKRALTLLLSLCCIFMMSPNVTYADDGNADTGGKNGYGETTNKDYMWPGSPSFTGYRVSVIDKTNGNMLGHTVDYLFSDGRYSNMYHSAEGNNKIQIKDHGGNVTIQSVSVRNFISTNWTWYKKTSSQIKAHFLDGAIINDILLATGSGLTYSSIKASENTTESGVSKYKILYEPMVVIVDGGKPFFLTATEFGKLYSQFTHNTNILFNTLPNGI